MPTYFCQASWFDCSASAPGACGTCRSGNLQAAMQNLRGFPQCYCGCLTAAVSCGQAVNVEDQCNGRTITVHIADHGPGACGGNPAGDCVGYHQRFIDLTRAAFSALVPLSQGLASVRIVY